MNVRETFEPFISGLFRAAAEVIKPLYFAPDLAVEQKGDLTPVTIADREAEAVIRRLIIARYPEHGIIGEEYGAERPDAEYVWTLDPIDGTISFTTGCPLFGTLIGLLHNGDPVFGGIYQPILDQLLLGDGRSCTLNGRAVHIREVKTLNEATLLATDLHAMERHGDPARITELRHRVRLFRTWGDCYGYLLTASGLADIMIDARMNLWDVVPLVPIMEGAGARVAAWNGAPAHRSNSCVAAHPAIFEEVLQYLR